MDRTSLVRKPTNPFRDRPKAGASDDFDDRSIKSDSEALSLLPIDEALSGEYADGDFPDEGLPPGFFDLVTNKNLHQYDVEQFVRRFEQGANADIRVKKTFSKTKGILPVDSATCPNVGIVFLPGADKPTVARIEQMAMTTDFEPSQRDSTWRANTAGGLLRSYGVNPDLGLLLEDITPKIVRKATERMRGSLPRDIDIVTIDSENVRILNGIRGDDGHNLPGYDHLATLIEVDAVSLVRLITHFQRLIAQSTPAMVPEENVRQLEEMMEDARFFYSRSPILFRMGTRKHIISSVDIRYGIDDQDGFRTICTSEVVRKLIDVSASYFNALDSAGTNEKDGRWQGRVRARFLQMLVLLLSMVADPDIKQISNFLLKTYGIKSERTDLELLLLKVIPLTSINPRVFLESLVPAVKGYLVPQHALDNEAMSWEILLIELAKKGYLLPGTVLELGHPQNSWLVRWPVDGIKSSQALGPLQLHGTTSQGRNPMRGFNEIVPIKVGSEIEHSQMTIYLHGSDKAYIIDSKDYEHIHCMDPGCYMLQDADNSNHSYELIISRSSLSNSVNSAIRLINKVIPSLDAMARPRNKLLKSVGSIRSLGSNRRHHQRPTLPVRDLVPEPEITRHEAWLEGGGPSYIAVSWKCDGRNISRSDMLNRMKRALDYIRGVVSHFSNMTGGRFGRHVEEYREVESHMMSHYRTMETERNTRAPGKAPVSPITRSIHANDEVHGLHNSPWFDYESSYSEQDLRLHIWAQRDMVRSVKWVREDSQAEVELAKLEKKFVLSALPKSRPDLEIGRADEVQVRDVVLMCGRYLIVAKEVKTPGAVRPSNGAGLFEMLNWLQIHSVEEQAQSARGRNKIETEVYESVFI